VSENRVLKILEPEGNEVTGEWRKLHNEEVHNLYSSLYTIRVIQLNLGRYFAIKHDFEPF
jgi:hypothetical protein